MSRASLIAASRALATALDAEVAALRLTAADRAIIMTAAVQHLVQTTECSPKEA